MSHDYGTSSCVPYMDYYTVHRAPAPSGCQYGLITQYIRVSSAHNDYIDAFGYIFNKYDSCLYKSDLNL